MEVHRHLGPGLMPEAYRDCLAVELRMKEIVFQRDAPLPFFYKGQRVESGITTDFLVEKSVILSVDAVDGFTTAHKNRLKNQLRLSGYEVGLLVNFNVENMRDGVKRIIVAEQPPVLHYRQEPEGGMRQSDEVRPAARDA